MSLKLLSNSKCFEGEQRIYEHKSAVTNSDMKFGVFMPPCALRKQNSPVLFFLSGLGASHENFIHKSGMQRYATQHGIIVVNPDTSPRNVEPTAAADNSGYLGPGAGFYVDATQPPWCRHYQMYSYVSQELPQLIADNFPILSDKMGIFGDSMGGHGALVCALRNPTKFKSISVFEPVANPTCSKIAQLVFAAYLGQDRLKWSEYDATCLAQQYEGPKMEILYEQGSADEFYDQGELLPENLLKAAKENGNINIIYKLREGYSHGSMFVKTFIEEHFEHHSKILKANATHKL